MFDCWCWHRDSSSIVLPGCLHDTWLGSVLSLLELCSDSTARVTRLWNTGHITRREQIIVNMDFLEQRLQFGSIRQSMWWRENPENLNEEHFEEDVCGLSLNQIFSQLWNFCPARAAPVNCKLSRSNNGSAAVVSYTSAQTGIAECRERERERGWSFSKCYALKINDLIYDVALIT